ncbi:MAG: DoxX family membrane protein [Actinomycetota bacterium]|nr:DoxX family membrane protein [Actinomycetota bacterium]MDQ3719996.1 DoxX family membrane protein [Actinomycetota bacterium]
MSGTGAVIKRRVLGLTFLAAGANHFAMPKAYEAIMPGYLPAHRELVLASGVAEAVGGAGVLSERTTKLAGWWLILTLVAVFPANVHMALHAGRYEKVPEAALWARLPGQALFMLWIWRVAIRSPTSRTVEPARWRRL